MTVAAPAPATALDVQAAIRQARETRTPMRLVGGGTWLDAGHPSEAAPLALDGLRGIVEYVPGDLTLTALAGTSLAEIARATAAEGQWLALDPFGSLDGTLGATVATASSGPLALAFGTPRDQVLGLEAVTGAGALIRVGGRVVKNVAGFDLTRLFTGSWGTLGAITEVSVRLRARPPAEAHVAVAVPDERPDAIAALAAAVRGLHAEPYAAELVSAPLAASLGLAPRMALLVRLGGNAAAVSAARDAIAALGRTGDLPAAAWDALRTAEPPGAIVVRLGGRRSTFAARWAMAADAVAHAGSGMVHGTPARGPLRVILPPDAGAAALALAGRAEGAARIERLPAAGWPAMRDLLVRQRAARGDAAVRARLLRGVREAYDPDRLMNPGLFDVELA